MPRQYRGSKKRHDDYNKSFSGESGERVLKDIMAYCHLMEPMQDADPHNALVREARRDVANMILMAMKFNPEKYEELLHE